MDHFQTLGKRFFASFRNPQTSIEPNPVYIYIYVYPAASQTPSQCHSAKRTRCLATRHKCLFGDRVEPSTSCWIAWSGGPPPPESLQPLILKQGATQANFQIPIQRLGHILYSAPGCRHPINQKQGRNARQFLLLGVVFSLIWEQMKSCLLSGAPLYPLQAPKGAGANFDFSHFLGSLLGGLGAPFRYLDAPFFK